MTTADALAVRPARLFALVVVAQLAMAASFATSAHASYGQMRLDGIGLALGIVLVVAWGLLVDVILWAQAFRRRGAAITGSIIGAVVVLLFLSQLAMASERLGFFRGPPGDAALVKLLATSAVFVPFVLYAPWAQHQSLKLDGVRWPRWVGYGFRAQVVLLIAMMVLPLTESFFYKRGYDAGYADGVEVQAGGLPALLERAGEQRERIWGTPIPLPGPRRTPAESLDAPTGWTVGIAIGLNESTLVRGDAPLGDGDRAALAGLVEQHFERFAVPHTRARLLWDALAPGNFVDVLAPERVSEETLPVLLDRLEHGGTARFCPEGRMPGADRAALLAMVRENGRHFEMRSPWDEYLRRAQRFCAAAE